MSRLVVGLGNPGPEYETTRHNVGFQVARSLAGNQATWRAACRSWITEGVVGGVPAVIGCPQTYMNRSGEAVVRLVHRFGCEPSELMVIHDDLDLAFGKLKIRVGGGHGGHNGIRSIVEALETGDFIRLKIGIGRPDTGTSVVDHVLSPFDAGTAAELPEVIARAVEAVHHIVREGPLQAMNRFHTS